ncbi:MAG: type II secretion system protein [Candidatus Fimimonas sp.]
MNKKTKKGFTIVELVIVIAVIAILAAVLIPTFSNVIKKANKAVDTQLIRNLNTALALDGKVHKTMQSALDAAADGGFDVGKISSKISENEILWDSVNDVFCYLNEGNLEYVPNSVTAAEALPANSYKLWIISDTIDDVYSTYYIGNDTVIATSKGFDAGKKEDITSVTYNNESGVAQDVVIRTNSGILTVNAPLDTVNHYDSVKAVAISSIADHSYHEYGTVDGEISIKEGHLVLESGSNAMFVNVNATTEAELAKISVSLESGSSYNYVTTSNNELISQVLAVVENKTGEETVKTLVKIDESAVAFVKHGEEVTEYSDIKLALNDFKTKEGATLELLDDIVNIEASTSKQISISMPKNGTINGNGKMIYGNVAIYVNAGGGSIYNTQFKYIHNNSSASQDECDWYGWISKEGKLSAIYASSLEGKLVIDGCLFDNIDWDAIQTTPKSGATIEITNNVFMHSDKTAYSQLRYIHIQASSSYTSATVTITGNEFYKTKNSSASAITNIGCWYVSPTETSDFTNNYFEYEGNVIDTNSELQEGYYSSNNIAVLIPALSTPNSSVGDLSPACYSGDTLYATLQDAINSGKTYIYLAQNNNESVIIPEGKTITIYTSGKELNGTITNNGTLKFTSGTSFGGNAIIKNNGSVVLKCNAAAGFTITENGNVSIESGATYDLSKISGNVTIKGGTFTSMPAQSQLATMYTAEALEDGTYLVRLINNEEAAAAGYVAKYSSTYYTTVNEALQKGATHLIADVTGESIEKAGMVDLYCDDFTFTGSVVCTGKTFYVDSGTAVLSNIDCGNFFAGYSSYEANITINNGKAANIKVAKNASLTINGGTYTGTITVATGGTASLVINGGTFSSNPTDYVNAETHTVIENADGTWTVQAK